MRTFPTAGCIVLALSLAAACGPKQPEPERRLAAAASDVARFLAGFEPFDRLAIADSVDLYVAPEGGGAHARFAREALRDPKAWQLDTGKTVRSFVPHGLRTRVVTDVGHYMKCAPSSLATRFPQLAAKPHVGVRLEPPRVKTCNDTWNATFVFDTVGGRPRLVAAIYDQPEW